jgi:hypothetical protein
MKRRARHLLGSLALLTGLAALAVGLSVERPPSAATSPAQAAVEEVIERGRYVFDWNGLPAAAAEFTLARKVEEGRPIFRFEGSARTTEGVDLFWRMRDSVVALVEERNLVPLRFHLFRRENQTRVDLKVVHDLEEEKFRIVRTKRGRVRRGTLPSRGVHDPVSAMLAVRREPLAPGQTRILRVMEGKRIYEVTLRVVGREKIVAGGKSRRALKIAADYRALDGSGSSADDGLRDARLWVSDDPAHELLRLEAEALLGVISGERVG